MKCKFNPKVKCEQVGLHCTTCRIFKEVGQQTLVPVEAPVIRQKVNRGVKTVFYGIPRPRKLPEENEEESENGEH